MSGGNYDRSKKNAILNPAVSYAFALQVEAAFMLPCRSVRVFTKENEFDYYQEGGLNDYVHLLRKPISKPFTFQVERYVGVSGSADFNMGFLDPLTLGTDLILPLVLYVNRSPAPGWADNISFTNCARAYIFTGCTVTAKEYGELNAEQSKLLTETTTIAYRELFTINQISPAWEKGDSWTMTSAEDYLGSGGSKGDNRSSNTKKQDLIDGASKWTLEKGDPYTGSGTSHKTNYSKNDSKKTREDAASKWEYMDPPYTGGGDQHESNRSKNDSKDTREKSASIYPPNRRALMADILVESGGK